MRRRPVGEQELHALLARKEDIGRELNGAQNEAYWFPTPDGPVVARRLKKPYYALSAHMRKTYDVLPRLAPRTAWTAASRHTGVVPPVLHASSNWLVVAGITGDDGEPAQTAPGKLADWSDRFIDAFAASAGNLTAVPQSSVLPPQVAPETDMNRYMASYVEYTYERCRMDERGKEYDAVGRELGFPMKASELLDGFKDGWAPLGFGLQHFDLHPGNALVSAGRVFFVDIDAARWAPHGSDLSRLPNMLPADHPLFQTDADAKMLPRLLARMGKSYSRSLPQEHRDGFEANWARLCAFDLQRSIDVHMHLAFDNAEAPWGSREQRLRKAGKAPLERPTARDRQERFAQSAMNLCSTVNKARAVVWQQPPITLSAVAELLAPMFGVRLTRDALTFNGRLIDQRITQALPTLTRTRPQAFPPMRLPDTRPPDHPSARRENDLSRGRGRSRER